MITTTTEHAETRASRAGRPRRRTQAASSARPDLEIVIPVYNEERVLAASVHRLHRFLSDELPLSWRITIVENASTDLTPDIGRQLAAELPGVGYMHLTEKGRGRALRAAWSASRARVVTYMDVDLSTDLRGLHPLVAPLLSGHSEVAIGTRLASGARVERGAKRELISRAYNRLLRTVLRARFSDAQCGFKAVRSDVLPQLLAAVRDQEWFFDTELLIAAQRRGLRIHEVPVDWIEDTDSRVDIVSTALSDLCGVLRLAMAAPLARFLAIGLASTIAYASLYLTLRTALPAAVANAVALGITALANTAANRRLTFGVRGRARWVTQYLAGLGVYLLALAVTSGGLAVIHRLDPRASGGLELGALVVSMFAATAIRYVALQTLVFGAHTRPLPH